MSLLSNYQHRYNSGEELLNRIEAAIAGQASYILIEDAQTANHAARLVWAKHCLVGASTRTMAQGMAWAVVANPTIAAALAAGTAVPDGDIEYVVNVNCHLFAPGAA